MTGLAQLLVGSTSGVGQRGGSRGGGSSEANWVLSRRSLGISASQFPWLSVKDAPIEPVRTRVGLRELGRVGPGHEASIQWNPKFSLELKLETLLGASDGSLKFPAR